MSRWIALTTMSMWLAPYSEANKVFLPCSMEPQARSCLTLPRDWAIMVSRLTQNANVFMYRVLIILSSMSSSWLHLLLGPSVQSHQYSLLDHGHRHSA